MKNFLFAAVLTSLSAAPALAQDQTPPPQDHHGAFMDACGQDVKTYCGSAQNRDDRRACMKANHDKFSDACKSFMASHHMHGHGQMQGPGGGQ